MGRRHRQRRTSKYFFYRPRIESKSNETVQVETISTPNTAVHTIASEDRTDSSSSWVSISTLPNRAEYPFTPASVLVPEHVRGETMTLPRISVEKINDERCEDDISLPRKSAEDLVSEDETEEAETTESKSKETLQHKTNSVSDTTNHTLTVSLEAERNSSSSWISMSTLPNFDSAEYPFTPTNISPEHSIDLPIFLPKISVEKISDEESKDDIKTEQAEPLKKDVESQKPIRKQDSIIFFNIVEKLAWLLKSGNGERLTSIFEKTFSLIEDKDASETDAVYEIMEIFLENLRGCSGDYLIYFKEHLNDAIWPMELRSLYVAKEKIKDHYFALGNGGFGEVRRAQLKKPGAPLVTVAVKEAHQASFNRMFLEEASVMARLNHEVILKLLAVTHDGDTVKLVLEYMENGDLVDAIMDKRLSLSPSDVLTIIHDVASGMQYLSEKQYVHRDLKCANVFINHRNECKIGDFGLCKYVGDSGGVYIDKKMRLDGPHIAPETKDVNRFTTKSDVWAMGLLIWELYSIQKVYSNTQNVLKSLFTIQQMWKMFLFCGHLLQVQGCPMEIHNYLVEEILNKNPMNRPSFGNIKKKIIDIIKKNHNYVTLHN